MAKESISLRDVYEAVNNLETKLDRRFTKVEEDVEKLQDLRGKMLGIMSVLSFFITGLFTFIWKKIEG